jgi:hypothetical protein
MVRHFEPLVVSNLRNCNVTTEILGGFGPEPEVGDDSGAGDELSRPEMAYAIATLDGNLIFAKNEELLWSLQASWTSL